MHLAFIMLDVAVDAYMLHCSDKTNEWNTGDRTFDGRRGKLVKWNSP